MPLLIPLLYIDAISVITIVSNRSAMQLKRRPESSSLNSQIVHMNVMLKLAFLGICEFWASATHGSTVMVEYNRTKAGMLNMQTLNTKSNIECAALCLNSVNCDGYQITKDEKSIACKMKTISPGPATAPIEIVYQKRNVPVEEVTTKQSKKITTETTSATITTIPPTTTTIPPTTTTIPPTTTTPFILPEKCIYNSELHQSISMAKFGDIIWMFSNSIEKDICRVRTVNEVLEFCKHGTCVETNRTSVAMFPQFPDGQVRIALGKNGNFVVFMEPYKFASYYVDGADIRLMNVTTAPPEESKTALSAIMIQSSVIFYLHDGTTTCYPDAKFINWANGAAVTWPNTETEMQTCNSAVDIVSRALRAKIGGTILGITRINNTYFVASSDIAKCEIYL